MNTYFNNVGETHGIKPQLHTYEYKRFLGRRMKDSFAFYGMTLNEMIQIIKTFDIKKTSNDIVPLKISKIIPEALMEELCSIFNHLVKDGTMPSSLKCSKVIPVFNNNNNNDNNNKRLLN